MKIEFESSPDRFGFPLRVIGTAGRYDTITDCEFIDDNHIVCADRQMARLYLVEFDLTADTHKILDTKECIVDGDPVNFEILYLRGSVLYSISYKNKLFSCSIVNNKFCNLKFVTIAEGEAYHGICGAGSQSVYLTNMLKNTITEYNVLTGAKRSMPCAGGVRMKDAAIINDKYYIALSSDRGPKDGVRQADGSVRPHNPPYDSHILVYERATGRLISRHTLEKTQIDGCVFFDGYCFVTCTNTVGGGFLLRCTFDDAYNFKDIVHIPCAGFPHGIAIQNELLAYTSYTESAVYIHKLKDFTNIYY